MRISIQWQFRTAILKVFLEPMTFPNFSHWNEIYKRRYDLGKKLDEALKTHSLKVFRIEFQFLVFHHQESEKPSDWPMNEGTCHFSAYMALGRLFVFFSCELKYLGIRGCQVLSSDKGCQIVLNIGTCTNILIHGTKTFSLRNSTENQHFSRDFASVLSVLFSPMMLMLMSKGDEFYGNNWDYCRGTDTHWQC